MYLYICYLFYEIKIGLHRRNIKYCKLKIYIILKKQY